MSASATIHELVALVRSDVRGFTQGMRQAASGTRELRKAWVQAGRDISTAATRVAASVTAVTTVVGGAAIRSFVQFEETMTRVGAVTRTLGTRDFAKLEETAKRLGATTRFTATQSAEAMEALGLAGFRVNEIIGAMPSALQLASAAQIEISEAAGITAKTMRAYGLAAADTGRINDVLVSTFTRANTTMGQLAEALRPVGPVAASVGVSLEDTAAILAKMADAGFQGETGGTALRNALIRMAAPSKQAADLLRDFGVWGDEPLFEKLQKISDGMQQMSSDQERLAAAAEIFGVRGGPQMISVFEAGIDSVRQFSEELRNSAGIAEELEQAQLQTLKGQFDLLRSAIDGVFLESGSKLRPELRSLIQEMTGFVEANADDLRGGLVAWLRSIVEFGRSAVAEFRESWPVIRETVQEWWKFFRPLLEFVKDHPRIVAAFAALRLAGVLGLTRAFSSLGVAVGHTAKAVLGGTLVSAVARAKVALVSLGVTAQAAWAAATLGVTLLVAAVVGAGAAAWAFRDEIMAAIEPVAEPFRELWEVVKELAAELWELASGAVAVIVDEWKAAFLPVLKEVGAIVRDTLVPAIRETFSTLSRDLGPVLIEIGRFALPIVRKAFQALADVALWLWKTALHGLVNRLETITKVVSGSLHLGITAAKASFEAWGIAIDATTYALSKLWEMAKLAMPTLGAVASAAGVILASTTEAEGSVTPPVAAAETVVAPDEPGSAPVVHRELDPANFFGARAGGRRPGSPVPSGGAGQPIPGAAEAAAEEAERFAAQREAIAERIEAGRQAALDKATPGHSTFRDILGMAGLTGHDAAMLASQQRGVSGTLAGRFGQHFDAIGGANADPAALDALATSMARIVNEEQRVAEAREVSTEGVREMADVLNGLRGSVPKEELDQFWQQTQGLKQALLDGAIGTDEFSAAMQRLRDATDEASAAADRKREREQREALLEGDFEGAGLDFQKALEDRIASFRMGQFNEAVEKAFQNLYPLAEAGKQVTDGFRQLTPVIRDFGENMAGSMKPGGNLADAFNRWATWASTAQGRAITLFNQIQIMQQGLEHASRKNRQEIEETIASLREQLDALLNASQPFVGESGDGFFRDPGFVDPEASRGGGSVMISLPNVTRVTNSEADMLAAKVGGSVARRGRLA